MNGHVYAPAGAIGGYSWFTPPIAPAAPPTGSTGAKGIPLWVWAAGAAVVGIGVVALLVRK